MVASEVVASGSLEAAPWLAMVRPLTGVSCHVKQRTLQHDTNMFDTHTHRTITTAPSSDLQRRLHLAIVCLCLGWRWHFHEVMDDQM